MILRNVRYVIIWFESSVRAIRSALSRSFTENFLRQCNLQCQQILRTFLASCAFPKMEPAHVENVL